MRKKAPVSGCLRKPEEMLVVNTACWVLCFLQQMFHQFWDEVLFSDRLEGSVGLKSGVTTHPNEGFFRWVVSRINLVFLPARNQWFVQNFKRKTCGNHDVYTMKSHLRGRIPFCWCWHQMLNPQGRGSKTMVIVEVLMVLSIWETMGL